MLLAMALAACDRADSAGTGGAPSSREAPGEPIEVLGTAYPLADVARQVGGERVRMRWLRESGQPPSALDPTPQNRATVSGAHVVITTGSAHPWTLEGSDDPYRAQRIIRLDTLVPDPAEQGADAFTTAPASLDPGYLWLDPRVVTEAAKVLATRLAARDPKRDALYRENAARFVASVERVTSEAESTLAAARGRPFASLDPGFAPLAVRFGLVPVDLPAVDPRNPGPRDLVRLRDVLRDAGAAALFVSVDLPAPVREDLARQLGMPVVPLDAFGSSAPAGRSTYLEVLSYNLEQLGRAAAI